MAVICYGKLGINLLSGVISCGGLLTVLLSSAIARQHKGEGPLRSFVYAQELRNMGGKKKSTHHPW